MEVANSLEAIPEDLGRILDELDAGLEAVPYDAIEEARQRSSEITPWLIRSIEAAEEAYQSGEDVGSVGHYYSLFLLAEFRALQAWPLIYRGLADPAGKTFERFEIVIADAYSCILMAFIGDDETAIAELIADPKVNDYLRWAAVAVPFYWIRDGKKTREEAIEFFCERLDHLVQTGVNKGGGEFDEVPEKLIRVLAALSADSAMPQIERAYESGIVDGELLPFDYISECIEQRQTDLAELLEDLPDPSDLIVLGEQFSEFKTEMVRFAEMIAGLSNGLDGVDGLEDFEDCEDDYDVFGEIGSDFGDELEGGDSMDTIHVNDTTIRNSGEKVGRNDKCPCMSGKKYKKCCGR
ncbi:DUF1186 domain-containing protein [Rhodopirellula sp. MGV]|uniref:DUF1186 domain-containing protein n=1 Tax=Rhodopirellula sp. MGV TaxID=2023130 RepID=UPI000CD03414|nr:DUF1186 domain-containing protein [Rhodopirellula sp. MGV]PNY37940.1 hypothetical protein C2E31_05425 [Rhodopirellula baltica]